MRVMVLGAGIQGVCVALALRQRGYRVTLIERMSDMMLRTSLRNEGKIHLGFVYANDPTFQTAPLMLRAALRFAPLLETWLEAQVDWRALCSVPFLYLIARDSMLTPKQLMAHYTRVQDCFDEIPACEAANYLGHDLRGTRLWQRASRLVREGFAPERVADSIETQELALDCEKFRALVRARVNAFPEITTRFEHTVLSIQRAAHGFIVGGTQNDGTMWREPADVVVNCLWDGRLALDHQLGIEPRRRYVMRLKYRLLGALAPALHGMSSITMVVGRYGDIVVYPDSVAYFSWYPTCMRGWSQALVSPSEWDAACAGKPPTVLARTVARETMDAFERLVPGISSSRIDAVDAGIIFSWGETDIDDYNSALHQRHEIGFTAHDGYYSIDTGKFTCAPLFAQELVKHLND